MATNSITKDFIVTDKKAFEQLKKDAASKCAPDQLIKKTNHLERGLEELKRFSFR